MPFTQSYRERDFENIFINELIAYGYRDRRNGNATFNKPLTMFVDDFETYLFKSQEELCQKIIEKEYFGNREQFIQEISIAASEYVYAIYNIAIQMRPNNKGPKNLFKFKGEIFNLYTPFINNYENQNVYSVSSQITFNIYGDRKHALKPDVFIFVNGFMYAYGELKYSKTGQSSYHAKRQIVDGMYDMMKFNVINKNIEYSDRNAINKEMRLFFSPAIIFAIDEEKLYVSRNLQQFSNKLYNSAKNNKILNKDNLQKDIIKNFYEFQSSSNSISKDPIIRFKQNIIEMFSFEHIQNEILYFNALKPLKKEERQSNGLLKVIVPRPVQLKGVEKTIFRIKKEHEFEERGESYEEYMLRNSLENFYYGIPHTQEEIEQHIQNRFKYKNNKNNLSILLQYAAGFGKTYVVCWLALQLKDMIDSNEEYSYKKIFILTDRVDLRKQMSDEITAMNISSSLIKNVENKQELNNALKGIDSHRIVIVNLQKFTNCGDVFGKELEHLKNDRFAFIIDEIHRSNNGVMHDNFRDIFEEIDNAVSSNKRNLIVGVTATPTEETLQKFGEYQLLPGGDAKWYPFDSYTMLQAIADGFVLDIRDKVHYYHSTMRIINNSSYEKTTSIYQNEGRINHNAGVMNDIMFQDTFYRIKGNAKAMLACYSIAQAESYYYHFTNLMKDKYLKENPGISEEEYDRKYHECSVPRPYIVYTSLDDRYPVAHRLSGFASEEKTIEAFKKGQNGLMIVVDKLQTGFDVPLLHTLFLDKEIHGINAIQTLSRVNRIRDNKKDCLIYDFSETVYDKNTNKTYNINSINIEKAFLQYEGMVVARNILGVETIHELEILQNELIMDGVYQEYHESIEMHRYEGALAHLPYKQYMRELLYKDTENKEEKEKQRNERHRLISYIYKLNKFISLYTHANNVIQLPKHIMPHELKCEFRELLNIISSLLKDNNFDAYKEMAESVFVNGFFGIERPFIVEENEETNERIIKHVTPKSESNINNIIHAVIRFNKEQGFIDIERERVEQAINTVFSIMKTMEQHISSSLYKLNSLFDDLKNHKIDYKDSEAKNEFIIGYGAAKTNIRKKLKEQIGDGEFAKKIIEYFNRLIIETPELFFYSYADFYLKK